MFKLRVGYFITGISTGLILLFTFLWTLPDGKLHIVFCDVGQGDGAYIRFPDGQDMVVDGGPNDKIIECLGKHMPFWDRKIDMVFMTHPQKDHMQGLISVFERYTVDYFVRSDVDNMTEGYKKLEDVVRQKRIPVRFMTEGKDISVGSTRLTMLWPSTEQIAKAYRQRTVLAEQGRSLSDTKVLGATIGELNDYSLVFHLQYGTFDAIFTGDADTRVESGWRDQVALRLAPARSGQALNVLEVLKVPHHGSKTGMTDEFIQWVKPALAVISVGKNSYGHPSEKALSQLATVGAKVLRTDQEGDIEVVSDGRGWKIVN